MFYRMYLSSVCNRREWPHPSYQCSTNPYGYYCKVRVNNREYSTDHPYATAELAQDAAAMKAWMICRNFSANDGMFPGQRPGQKPASGVIQGLPTPIGTGRGNKRDSTSSSEDSSSGSNSPKSFDSGFDLIERRAPQPMPKPPPRRKHNMNEYVCLCHRGVVRSYGRCDWCLREAGWA